MSMQHGQRLNGAVKMPTLSQLLNQIVYAPPSSGSVWLLPPWAVWAIIGAVVHAQIASSCPCFRLGRHTSSGAPRSSGWRRGKLARAKAQKWEGGETGVACWCGQRLCRFARTV